MIRERKLNFAKAAVAWLLAASIAGCGATSRVKPTAALTTSQAARNSSSPASWHIKEGFPSPIAASGSRTCTVDEKGLTCWGTPGTRILPLKNPRMVAISDVGRSRTCVLDDDGVSCWDAYGSSPAMKLNHPYMISAGEHHTCALDEDGLHCWNEKGEAYMVDVKLKNPKMISSYGNGVCALDDEGIKCTNHHEIQDTVKNPRMISLGGPSCAIGESGVQCIGGLEPTTDFKNPRYVSAYGDHACAIDEEGVKCWGRENTPNNVPSDLRNPRIVVTGEKHACAVDDTGVKCWGKNDQGQLDVPKPFKNARALATDKDSACALDDDGLRCWGGYTRFRDLSQFKKPTGLETRSGGICVLDEDGRHCLSSDDSAIEFFQIPLKLQNPKKMWVGKQHSCVLDETHLQCWGDNKYRQLEVPADLKSIGMVAVGAAHTCALANVRVTCWGSNEHGQMAVPAGFKHPRMLAAGSNHNCVLDNYEVKCWGDNSEGQTDVPKTLEKPYLVAAGEDTTCAADSNGLNCWGKLKIDALSKAYFYSQIHPSVVSVSNAAACALSSGRMRCFYDKWHSDCDERGEYCKPNIHRYDKLSVPGDLSYVSELAVGTGHICTITEKGVRCWGEGLWRATAVPKDLQSPTMLSANGRHSCVFDGSTIKCWGAPWEATAAPFALKNQEAPIVKGWRHGCALDEGAVTCWGDNSAGQLNVPTDLKNPKMITGGQNANCALDDRGIQCWGDGLASNVPKDLKNPRAVSARGNNACAIDDSGLRCWDFRGQFQIPFNIIDPSSVSIGDGTICVTDRGDVKCWRGSQFDSEYYGTSAVPSRSPNIKKTDISTKLQLELAVGWFQNVARFLYGYKKSFLLDLQKYVSDSNQSADTTILTLNLLNSWMRSIDIPAFKSDVVQNWDNDLVRAAKFTKIASAAEISLGTQTNRSALAVLAAALSTSKEYLPAEHQPTVESLLVNIRSETANEAITNEIAKKIARDIRASKPLLDVYHSNERLHSADVVINDVINWLEH